jgi:hypothetical protein
MFKEKIMSAVELAMQRNEHAEKEILTLKPSLTKLHQASDGATNV